MLRLYALGSFGPSLTPRPLAPRLSLRAAAGGAAIPRFSGMAAVRQVQKVTDLPEGKARVTDPDEWMRTVLAGDGCGRAGSATRCPYAPSQ